MSPVVLQITDTETNGFNERQHSLLSLASLKVVSEVDGDRLSLHVRDSFVRYYLPVEPLRLDAVRVNGLSQDVLMERRAGQSWPLHAVDDAEAMIAFAAGF